MGHGALRRPAAPKPRAKAGPRRVQRREPFVHPQSSLKRTHMLSVRWCADRPCRSAARPPQANGLLASTPAEGGALGFQKQDDVLAPTGRRNEVVASRSCRPGLQPVWQNDKSIRHILEVVCGDEGGLPTPRWGGESQTYMKIFQTPRALPQRGKTYLLRKSSR